MAMSPPPAIKTVNQFETLIQFLEAQRDSGRVGNALNFRIFILFKRIKMLQG